MKKFIALFLASIMCFVFSSCKSPDDEIIGTWQLDIINDADLIDGVWDTIELYEGGTGSMINHNRSYSPDTGVVSFPKDIECTLTWEITDGNILNIHYTDNFYGEGSCGFKLSENTLTSVDGKYICTRTTTPIENVTLIMTKEEYDINY